MKNRLIRNLLLILLVAIGLGGALYWALNVQPEVHTDPIEQTDTQPPLYTFNSEDITQMQLKNPTGEYTFYKDEIGWAVQGVPTEQLVQAKIDSLALDYCNINQNSIIEQEETDLSIYGLDQPTASITLTFTDQTERTFFAGNKTPTRTAYYFKEKSSPTVFTLYSSKADALFEKLGHYRSKDIAKFEAEKITEVKINGPQNQLHIKRQESDPADEYGTMSVWDIVQPIEVAGANDKIQEKLIDPLVFTAKDFAQTLEFTPVASIEITAENTTVIEFGENTADGTPVRVAGQQTVYLCEPTEVFNVNVFDVCEKFLNLMNIDRVNSVEVLAQENYYMEIIRQEGEENDENTVYKINDEQVKESDFKAAYQAVIGLSADGLKAKEGANEVAVTIQYNLRDNSTQKIELLEYDNRSYLARTERGEMFIVHKQSVTQMFNQLNMQ